MDRNLFMDVKNHASGTETPDGFLNDIVPLYLDQSVYPCCYPNVIRTNKKVFINLRRMDMRKRTITDITAFSTTREMVKAIRDVSDELGISMSELIRRAVEDYFQRKSLDLTSGIREECSETSMEDDNGLL